ncbi:MAG TPA: FtsX-like permease family protein, partial [Opitutus sp.]|nr:FtsX-like permease family protein [Opitutus sp.]
EPLEAETSALTVVARGDAPADSLTGPLVKAFGRLFAEPPLFMVNSVRGHLYETLRESRDTARLFMAFGGVAVLLASVGLYGVTAFAVRQRTQEFGVRIALGTTTSHIVNEVARRSAAQFAIGAMIGSAIAMAVGAASYAQLEGFLYQITPFDLQTYLIVAVLLATATTLACAVPALRAAKVDPMVALRCE